MVEGSELVGGPEIVLTGGELVVDSEVVVVVAGGASVTVRGCSG